MANNFQIKKYSRAKITPKGEAVRSFVEAVGISQRFSHKLSDIQKDL